MTRRRHERDADYRHFHANPAAIVAPWIVTLNNASATREEWWYWLAVPAGERWPRTTWSGPTSSTTCWVSARHRGRRLRQCAGELHQGNASDNGINGNGAPTCSRATAATPTSRSMSSRPTAMSSTTSTATARWRAFNSVRRLRRRRDVLQHQPDASGRSTTPAERADIITFVNAAALHGSDFSFIRAQPRSVDLTAAPSP